MPIANTEKFADSIRRHHLLDSDQVAQMEGLRPQMPDAKSLARELLQRSWLTAFQANMLLQGRAQELTLGSYVLLERIGEGGMGQVYKARNWKLGQVVALKVIRKERIANPESLRRFHREIRAVAQLAHPNIVHAYDADEVNGIHFFAMEFVEGTDLARLVKRHGTVPVGKACDHIRQAALGLQHAYERGLVHRDIKPHNLLLSKDGVVKVVDMGLARVAESAESKGDASSMTQEGAVMGTPDYIAPEQALESRTVDIRADLYSLGCTFYFLLTGAPPFPTGTLLQKLNKHQFEEARPVEQIRPEVPGTVATIVRRLLAKRPEDRFQTPAELALALSNPDQYAMRFQETGPGLLSDTIPDISAATELNLARRKPKESRPWLYVSLAGGALLVALTVLVIVLATKRQPVPDPVKPAEPPLTFEDKARSTLHQLMLRGDDPHADQVKLRQDVLAFRQNYVSTSFMLRSAELLAQLPSPLDRLDPRKIQPYELAVVRKPLPPGLVAILGDSRLQHWNSIGAVAFSPDGKILASGGQDRTIRLWDVVSGRQLHALVAHTQPPVSLMFSPDGKTLASAADEPRIILWQVATGIDRVLTGHKGWVSSIAFHPDGSLLASASRDASIKIWDVQKGQVVHTLTRRTASGKGQVTFSAVAFSPDGGLLASGGYDNLVRLWQTDSWEQVATCTGHKLMISSLLFSPDGHTLASASADRTINIWEVKSGKLVRTLVGHSAGLLSLGQSNDGRVLISGSYDYTARLWDPSTGKQLRNLGSNAIGAVVALSPNGEIAVAGGTKLRLWKTATGAELFGIGKERDAVRTVAFQNDSSTLALGMLDGKIRLWDAGSGTERQAWVAHPTAVEVLAFSPDDKLLASSCPMENKIKLWDMSTGQVFETITGPSFAVRSLMFSPNGELLAYGRDGGGLVVWDVNRKKQLWLSSAGTGSIHSISFSPDSKVVVAIRLGEKFVRFYEALTGRELQAPFSQGPNPQVVAFGPGGKVVATGGLDGNIKLQDAGTGELERTMMDPDRSVPPGQIGSLAFRCDGQLLASAGADGAIRLWDPTTGKKRETIRFGPPGSIISKVTFSPEGRYLATANGNGTVYLLRLAPAPAVLQAKQTPSKVK